MVLWSFGGLVDSNPKTAQIPHRWAPIWGCLIHVLGVAAQFLQLFELFLSGQWKGLMEPDVARGPINLETPLWK